MIKQIKKLFKFLIDDTKKDMETLKHVSECVKDGKPIMDPEKKQELIKYLKTFDVGEFLKEYWMGILFCILCFVVGWWLSSQYYQIECNNFIYENYVVNQVRATWNATIGLPIQ